jgi:outer membrane protein assembly factor BamA
MIAAFSWTPFLGAQDAPEVRKISFTGAHAFDDALLEAAIISNQTRCKIFVFCDRQYVDEIGLRGDLVRLRLFYYQRGFRKAQIGLDTARVGNGLEVRFAITEGTPVRVASVQLSGAEEVTVDPTVRRALRGALPLVVGQPFSVIEYEAARDTLTARLANLGFARADVLANYTIPRDSQYTAHVQFEIFPGDRLRFGQITIEGNRSVAPKVIQRQLTFKPGHYYSHRELFRSQRNLFQLETFRHVEIRADVNATTDTLVPVVVQVNEGNLHRVRFGVGASTAEYVNTEFLWAARNFSGRARRLEVRGRLYNLFADALHDVPGFEDTGNPYNNLAGSLSADFSQPWFFDASNSINAGLYVERRSLPDIFVRTGRGAYVNLAHSPGPGSSVSLGYRPELTELNAGGDVFFCQNFVACGPEEISVLREPHWLSPLAVSYTRDRSNSLLAPTSGYILRFDGEYAARGVGSDFSYSRLQAEVTDYHQFMRGVVIATRMRPGWARALGEPRPGLGLHPQKRFFGGGPNSVRGFAQFRMGPKLLTVNAATVLAADSVAPCTAQQINSATCDVNDFIDRREADFDVRPVGGAAILEGNAELRVPFFFDKVRAVAFVDFGHVWREAEDVNFGDVVLTPGFGFRYFSAIGPVRVDIGYNPSPAERLEVVTTKVCHQVSEELCEPIQDGVEYESDSLSNTTDLLTLGSVLWHADRSVWRRFQLHFSIGQAF